MGEKQTVPWSQSKNNDLSCVDELVNAVLLRSGVGATLARNCSRDNEIKVDFLTGNHYCILFFILFCLKPCPSNRKK